MDGFLKIETPALHCEKCGRVIPTNGGVVETQKGAKMISIPRLGCEFCAREAGGVGDKLARRKKEPAPPQPSLFGDSAGMRIK